jgi:predicted nucleic acid-binding protein
MRYVLDTNVLAAALRSDAGASRQLLSSAIDGTIIVWASVPLRLKDPADVIVLETAINGRADRLLTFDLRHLAAN